METPTTPYALENNYISHVPIDFSVLFPLGSSQHNYSLSNTILTYSNYFKNIKHGVSLIKEKTIS